MLLGELPQRFLLSKSIHKCQYASTTYQICSPRSVILEHKLTWQPVHVVVVNVEALFGIGSPAAAECRMENLPVRPWLVGLGNDHNNLGVSAAFLKQTTNGDEIQNLPDIPSLDELAAKTKRLLIVEKVVLLKQREHAALGKRLHRFMEEEVGKLLVG